MAKNIYFPVVVSILPKDDPRYQKWLLSLKKRPPPWNKGKTKETDVRIQKISISRKECDNFAVWRENARKQGLIPGFYQEFKRDINLAFIIGLILGDGNLYQFPPKRLGIPSGARGKLPIKLPKWVWQHKEFLIGCLKGLLDEVEKALYLLGFHPERRYNAVRLRKKVEAFNFVELIQFRKYNSI